MTHLTGHGRFRTNKIYCVISSTIATYKTKLRNSHCGFFPVLYFFFITGYTHLSSAVEPGFIPSQRHFMTTRGVISRKRMLNSLQTVMKGFSKTRESMRL